MEKNTFKFLCVDEQGNEYTIFEFTEYYLAGLSNVFENENVVPGLQRYETSDGLPCNRLDLESFSILPDEIKVKVKQ